MSAFLIEFSVVIFALFLEQVSLHSLSWLPPCPNPPPNAEISGVHGHTLLPTDSL